MLQQNKIQHIIIAYMQFTIQKRSQKWLLVASIFSNKTSNLVICIFLL